MSATQVLSGKKVSQYIYESLASRIKTLKNLNIIPSLAAVLVGNNPASAVYVRSKERQFSNLQLHTKTFRLNQNLTELELLQLLDDLNHDDKYHGILIQLPLPKHLDAQKILWSIDPRKDVDGFHPENAGLLAIGQPRYIPCTPKGIIKILEYGNINISGKHVVVIGRSNIVGRPISILTSLKRKNGNGTTTLCHSGTLDMKRFIKQADVIIAALGRPNHITGDMLKPGAVVIDVGINRVNADNEKGYKLVGDVKWESIQGIASAATPVPGGIGPMTIAMLVENTVEAAEYSQRR
ncbi:MAG: bifunctional 5,10-methylenetetrahydrofolate dehydrogenase/5,10-methenyltetrahydrofolate cyclohydrolase [Candidatus Marinimicrobia bacterium]|jgi:methylenetetrahydrofolate dehydrogenase (NADP+)/methenyltetrahydrofolate cyclohydrolase|nr:bifunctional 5,10-methylenetetrahydrofolate dehydrogenase/5,10-methenyltetrahydrofolate cyclohydrolase [Candidatus Neomarinimicrobiota bacterium]MDP6401453.1 bifunctional 5,10-methylenetetrahydrofolate dehydrogenase/5,10-methenyltetrahydrofolate cyclohydrolase [Candidatus Neomarinimicrobiota bacterium]|tara:strand:+ start:432 stop:1316 length:885 start_codon:yes stop_codon:yes gene_type:complete